MKIDSGHGGSALSEINVTPLVDVMLVLLIVFMVSAPLMQQGVQVDLPKANAGSIDEVPDQAILVIRKDRRIFLNDKEVKRDALISRLAGLVEIKPNLQVVVQADQEVPYGQVAQVIADAKKANISRVGLATAPETNKRSR